MKYKMKMGGMEHEVRVVEVDLDLYRVYVDDKEFDVEVESNMVRRAVSAATPAASTAAPAPSAARASAPSAAAPPAARPAGAGVVAPMPGKVLRILVTEGDSVQRGSVVAILEAMKMENELRSGVDGTIGRIPVKEGQNVSKGDLIAEVA
ncbi:MAG: biotin/lipoyl-containing protein [Thermoleophilia bacterium]